MHVVYYKDLLYRVGSYSSIEHPDHFTLLDRSKRPSKAMEIRGKKAQDLNHVFRGRTSVSLIAEKTV